jgi:hypothetical protein
MGKMNKKELVKLAFPPPPSDLKMPSTPGVSRPPSPLGGHHHARTGLSAMTRG